MGVADMPGTGRTCVHWVEQVRSMHCTSWSIDCCETGVGESEEAVDLGESREEVDAGEAVACVLGTSRWLSLSQQVPTCLGLVTGSRGAETQLQNADM